MTIEFKCDMCGSRLRDSDPDRYIVQIEVFASADRIILNSQTQTSAEEQMRQVLEELKNADPDVIEDQTYRRFRYDLCRRCQKHYLTQPLPRPIKL